jgi:ribosome-binding protein aMBF1 (putative translation factor)
MKLAKTLGARIESLRVLKGLTRKQLSATLQVKENVLRDLENLDSTPRGLQQLLPLLAKELEVSVNFLVTGENPMEVDAILFSVSAIHAHAKLIADNVNK